MQRSNREKSTSTDAEGISRPHLTRLGLIDLGEANFKSKYTSPLQRNVFPFSQAIGSQATLAKILCAMGEGPCS
jgi:hypothetical protein